MNEVELEILKAEQRYRTKVESKSYFSLVWDENYSRYDITMDSFRSNSELANPLNNFI